MAVRLLNAEISDLCLGKPELAWISASASISDALAALKASGDTHVSVWVCDSDCANGSCICVGKFSVADVILFLCREENLADPFKAFEAPVSDVLPKSTVPVVRHLEANSCLLEAIEYLLEGTQNLVIPIKNKTTINTRKQFINRQQQASDCNRHRSHQVCWLTQEDVLRYLFNSIPSFSPTATFSIESLNVIDRNILTLPYNKPASSALGHLSRVLTEQKPIAVIDDENRLFGEISPFSLTICNETAASAIMALSAAGLMAYIQYSNPPEGLVQLVKTKLEEKKLLGMVDLMDEFFHSTSSSSSSCSSDDELLSSGNGRSSRISSWGQRFPARRSEALTVCSSGSSLVAVMMQALANRLPSVWVLDEDQTLVGAVTLAGMLEVLHNVASGFA